MVALEETETMPAKMTEAEKVLRFALAGNATFTIASLKTGTRFTYKMRQSEDGMVWFVKVLTGADNESDYTFLGTIGRFTRSFCKSPKSPIAEIAPSVLAFVWFWSKITAGHLPVTLEFFHEGRCGRCGRKLTVPESIMTGLGPECASRS